MVAVRDDMPRTRKGVAILCVALVVFAAFVPAGAANLVVEMLTPLWLVVPAVTVAVVPDSETNAVMPLVVVVTELPLVRATSLPSMRRISAAPSVTLKAVVMAVPAMAW